MDGPKPISKFTRPQGDHEEVALFCIPPRLGATKLGSHPT